MIKIKNISGRLTPPNSDPVYVCENNDIHIKKNEYIAIVGESGSGKSQFVKTLSGLNEDYYELTQGSIEYILNDTESFLVTSNSGSNDINYSSIK